MALLSSLLPATLETERLILELFEYSEAHYNTLLTAMNSESAHQNMGDLGIKTVEDFDELNQATRLTSSVFPMPTAVDRDLYYIFKLKDDGSLIGGISLAQRSPRVAPDVGWAVLEKYQRQGYAPEAAKVFLRFLQDSLKISEIIAWPGVDNLPSIQVAKKIGLVEGPVIKDSQTGTCSVIYLLPGMRMDSDVPMSIYGE